MKPRVLLIYLAHFTFASLKACIKRVEDRKTLLNPKLVSPANRKVFICCNCAY